ncbi:hypothetical protein DV451_001554 [Geotrichum candidum]|uniref:Nascent polypeptide-associated complex subunit beta n=1 Tax=Geotrichum candidum TaxID=1173061 RepID=A0A0J9XBN2_GEOCN|nr:hypothetical protein DV451_001554 [Geotrichum candidum]KAI9214212.1 hypothetical protein DS838_000854 [Geotrichum bryndzae]KAF5105887.1 hypothetical protein DV453_004434 [Geotrichum candidum]KAF5115339.1 hypothetical protein DV454_002375 [Geotrichum candidum]KAF5119141.1 hypothetical protein DV452_001814 [Geotrichum candidum]
MVDAEKLAKLQKSVRIGGKGTPRRKVRRTHKSAEAEDKKIQDALKKLDAQQIPSIDEANFFREDGTVLHFNRPAVQGAAPSNTYAIHGNPQEKDLGELMPNIISQMGPESIEQLRQYAEQLAKSGALNAPGGAKDAEDDEIPELVEGETFDKVD